jgi:hypothetical protein
MKKLIYNQSSFLVLQHVTLMSCRLGRSQSKESSRIVQSWSTSPSHQQHFIPTPNLTFKGRHRAHASSSATSRGWSHTQNPLNPNGFAGHASHAWLSKSENPVFSRTHQPHLLPQYILATRLFRDRRSNQPWRVQLLGS